MKINFSDLLQDRFISEQATLFSIIVALFTRLISIMISPQKIFRQIHLLLIKKISGITSMNGKFCYLGSNPESIPSPPKTPGFANPPYSLIYFSPIPLILKEYNKPGLVQAQFLNKEKWSRRKWPGIVEETG